MVLVLILFINKNGELDYVSLVDPKDALSFIEKKIPHRKMYTREGTWTNGYDKYI